MKKFIIALILAFAFVCIVPGKAKDGFARKEAGQKKGVEKARSLVRNNQVAEGLTNDKVVYLEEIVRIEDGFSNEEHNYFEKITSVCVDKNDNLFVADSESHRIFKFDEKRRFQLSFGAIGQGNGEFLGDLRMSVGNDNKLYVTDDGNWRLSVFSLDGRFLRQLPIEKYVYDIPSVNTRGDIFLLSTSGLKVIDVFNSEMGLLGSLVELDSYLDFPYKKPSLKITMALFRPTINNMKKLTTHADEIITLSNMSLWVHRYDKDFKLINKFRVEHPRFINNYRKRLDDISADNGWLDPFGTMFLDDSGNICLGYFNRTIDQPEIYRYAVDGQFIDTIRIVEPTQNTNQIVSACDTKGDMISIVKERQAIAVLRVRK